MVARVQTPTETQEFHNVAKIEAEPPVKSESRRYDNART
jgi:hypothetical protein